MNHSEFEFKGSFLSEISSSNGWTPPHVHRDTAISGCQVGVEATMPISGFIGIDNGTQGLSVVFTRQDDLVVLATGEASYDFVDGLDYGCYEQNCRDWEEALELAMQSLLMKLAPRGKVNVLAIGISGQMHGEVLLDDAGQPLQNVRLWCGARNEREGEELTQLFHAKVPKRATAARFLWTCRNRPDIARRTAHLTTPAGYMGYKLTGEFHLGIGDSAGMFPISEATKSYDVEKIQQFDALVQDATIPSLARILPMVQVAGGPAGSLTPAAAAWLGIPDASGIPVAASEGDQVAALAGSLIGDTGMVSCSFGTSVCANAIGDDRRFVGVSPAVDHFCAADGKSINMVWLRNGTTYLNTIMESYGEMLPDGRGGAFERIMPKLVGAPADCGGLLALPFLDDEPGLGVSAGGTALIIGWSAENAKAENVAKAALVSTIFNLKLGCIVLDEQGYPRTEIILSGGLTKSPQCAQIVADIFNVPCHLLDSANEGCCWGAAVLAKYRYEMVVRQGKESAVPWTWPQFLATLNHTEHRVTFEPIESNVQTYEQMFQRYQRLLRLEPQLRAAAMKQQQ
jgi:sugar (pentulose or hexulose) kinase